MNYTESLEYVHSLQRFGMKPGLERIKELLEILGNPQDKFKAIHVAGTNGKGSSSTMMAEILKSTGYKTGLYTSPYVLQFRERIKINSEMISEDCLAQSLTIVKEKIDLLNQKNIEITEFEAITAAAFVFFANEGCDFAVIEVGLGGRLDATNVLKSPAACVITSISYDHMDVLGDNISQITNEKCGIIKEKVPVFTSKNQDANALAVIKKICRGNNSDIYISNPDDAIVIQDDAYECGFEYKGNTYTLYLNGKHQIENALNVIETAKYLKIAEKDIYSGIKQTRMLARMEIISQKPLIIREGGHNEGCALALKDFIERYKVKNIHMIIGMMADKDVEKYIGTIAPLCKSITTVSASNNRRMEAGQLAAIAEKYCRNVKAVDNPKEAYMDLTLSADADDTILVCGSFYLMSDIFCS